MTEAKGRLIVVLGMHRSGTSAVTKSLELMGVGLGDNLHPAGFDNPKGFWEDRGCIAINDNLLSHLGSAYDRLSLAWDEIPDDDRVNAWMAAAVELVSRKLDENSGLWGFKDPRTCRLLVFWHRVFLAVKCEVCLVMAVRNPLSVAASLAARNGIAAEKAYYLWLQHVLPPLGFMKEAKRVVVDYDELLSNPYSQMVRISTRLGLPLPDRENPRVKDFENNFLESGLRHTFFTENDLASDARASPMVGAAYGLLRRLATDRDSLGNSCVQDELDELNARLKEASPAFDYINVLENGLGPEMAKRDGQIANLDRMVAVRDSQIDSLNQVIAERDRQINAYREQAERIVAQLHEANLRISGLNQDLAERDRHIANLNQVITERDGQIHILNQAVAELHGHIANLDQMVAARDSQIDSLNQVITEHDGQINAYREQAERIVAQLHEANLRISGLNQDLAERDRHIANLNQVITGRDGQINAYREQAERIVAQLHEARTRISHLDREVAERDLQIARLNQEVTEYIQRDVAAEEPRLPDGFDRDIYLKLNPDVAAAELDPEMHYLRHGRRERRLYQLPATNVCGDDGAREGQSDLRGKSP